VFAVAKKRRTLISRCRLAGVYLFAGLLEEELKMVVVELKRSVHSLGMAGVGQRSF
jgi:hypothetical protein